MAVMQKYSVLFSLIVGTVVSLEMDVRNICINSDSCLHAVQGRIQNLMETVLMKCVHLSC